MLARPSFAGFTLDTYVHLLDGDLGQPLEFVRDNRGTTGHPKIAANATSAEDAKAPN